MCLLYVRRPDLVVRKGGAGEEGGRMRMNVNVNVVAVIAMTGI
jgi:hypothetical protein